MINKLHQYERRDVTPVSTYSIRIHLQEQKKSKNFNVFSSCQWVNTWYIKIPAYFKIFSHIFRKRETHFSDRYNTSSGRNSKLDASLTPSRNANSSTKTHFTISQLFSNKPKLLYHVMCSIRNYQGSVIMLRSGAGVIPLA